MTVSETSTTDVVDEGGVLVGILALRSGRDGPLIKLSSESDAFQFLPRVGQQGLTWVRLEEKMGW